MKDVKVRKSHTGKSKYVMHYNGKKYRGNTFKQLGEICGLHFTRVHHLLKEGNKLPKYEVEFKDEKHQCFTLREISKIVKISLSSLQRIKEGKQLNEDILIRKIND